MVSVTIPELYNGTLTVPEWKSELVSSALLTIVPEFLRTIGRSMGNSSPYQRASALEAPGGGPEALLLSGRAAKLPPPKQEIWKAASNPLSK